MGSVRAHLTQLIAYSALIAGSACYPAGIVGGAFAGTVGGLASGLLTNTLERSLDDILKRLQGNDAVLGNHDLSQAAGLAVAALLALAAKSDRHQKLREKLTLMSRLAETKWLDSVHKEDLDEMGEVELVEVLETGTFNLSLENWEAIVADLEKQTPAVRGMLLSEDANTQLALELRDGFAVAFREVLKADFAKDGRAFAGYLIDVLTNIQKDVDRLGLSAADSARLTDRLQALQAGDESVIRTLQELSGQMQSQMSLLCDRFGVVEQTLSVLLTESRDYFVQLVSGQKDLLTGQSEMLAWLALLQDSVDALMERESAIAYAKDLTLRIPTVSPDKIVGREVELKMLRDRLDAQRQVVLVNGLGGIGKTTLAQVYVHQFYDRYAHIAWVTQTGDDFLNDFTLASGLLESLHVVKEGKEISDLFRAAIAKLKEIKKIGDKPNLLVLDNAEASLAGFADVLPNPPHWHILVTSRQQIVGFEPLELGFLSEDAAIALFERHYKLGQLTREQIIRLVRSVDYHTLTIEILAKVANEHIRYELLANALDIDLMADVTIPHQGNSNVDRVLTYLSKIFQLSSLSDDEIWLLQQLTCLPSDYHSFDLLESLIVPGKHERRDSFPYLLSRLVKKGWLIRNSDSVRYKQHRVVAEVVSKERPVEYAEAETMIQAIAGLLNIDQTKDNPVDKFQWIPFGRACLAQFEEEMREAIAELQNHLAMVLRDFGDYEGAKVLLEKATASDEHNFGSDHPNTARSYSNLALVLQDLGDYEGAKELLAKATASDEHNFGTDHPSTAVSYSNLALVLRDLGDYQGAKELLEKATASDEHNFGSDHPTRAVSYSNLALVLQDLGDYQGAKELLEKATASAEHNLGSDHPTTAVSYSNLALVLKDLGEGDRAINLASRSLTIFESVLPPGHPYIDRMRGNLQTIREQCS
ncbi:MAG: tetratricopeptide repeat protein [Cyanobacteria bacterium J06642_2]